MSRLTIERLGDLKCVSVIAGVPGARSTYSCPSTSTNLAPAASAKKSSGKAPGHRVIRHRNPAEQIRPRRAGEASAERGWRSMG
ncbi:MAG: hypothetical protein R2705_11200 [Ilumatobacteraceae bacterium]